MRACSKPGGSGLGDPAPISAEHGEGMADLFEALAAVQEKLERTGAMASLEPDAEAEEPFDPDAEAPPELDKPVRIAFVGRPNAGKSTLVNGILDDDRFVTGPEAGITRDSVTVAWKWRDREIRLVDTAGLRKRARVQEKLERLSTMETTHSHPLRRRGRAGDGSAGGVREAGRADRQPRHPRGPRARLRHHEVGHDRCAVRSAQGDGAPGRGASSACERDADGDRVGRRRGAISTS